MEKALVIRLIFFFGIFAAMALFEDMAPRRPLETSKAVRWFSNISITFLNSFLVRIIFPLTAVGAGAAAAERGWGLFNLLDVPIFAAGVASVVILDGLIYVQHVVFHVIGPFWRLHMMHHLDLDPRRDERRPLPPPSKSSFQWSSK